MNPQQWLKRFLFIYTKKDKEIRPDGRPLYAYRCSDKKYNELKEHIRDWIKIKPHDNPYFDAAFCLYAAETWRRKHDGGVWKWETIFQEIGRHTPNNHYIIRSFVEAGLHYWQRDILHGSFGDNKYLVTIACEGGLPLKLLQRENTNLKQYFRQLLAEYHRHNHSTNFQLDLLARQIAALCLPKTLQHDIVYQLSGQLVAAVVELQAKIPDEGDPIAALDKQDEKWRNNLPLSVEDDTFKALIGGLMRQAKEYAIAEQQRIRLRRYLLSNGNHWMLESRLELPNKVSETSLSSWTGQAKHPTRLYLLLQSTEGSETVARMTRTQSEAGTAQYRLEMLRQKGVRFTDAHATESKTLWLSDGGDKQVRLPVVGDVDLGELPWVFVEHNTEKEWLAEGTTQTKNNEAFVLAPSDCTFNVIDGGVCELRGNAQELQRNLYVVQGKVRFDLLSGESCLVQCAADSDTDEEWTLGGKTLALVLNPRPIYIGKPTLEVIGENGKRRVDHSCLLEWRTFNAPNETWSRDFRDCAGMVWIRAFDSDKKIINLRRKAEVLPADVQIEVILGIHAEPGIIRLSGLGTSQISVPAQPGCQIELTFSDGVTEIRCFAEHGLPITQFPLEMRWPNGQKLTLTLPFPRQGAAFVQGGNVLERCQTVPLGRLDGIIAVAQSPKAGNGFMLWADIRTDDRNSIFRKLWLRQNLRLENGSVRFELHGWREHLDRLLSMTETLDSSACLEIRTAIGGNIVTKLEIARFDIELEPDKEKHRVMIYHGSLKSFDDGWQNRVSVKMIPLWNPTNEPIILTREDSENGIAWRVPDELPTGPWWILGCDGDWPRLRPLLWMVQNDETTDADDPPNLSPLQQTICSPDETRPDKMRELVKALADNPAHQDWTKVFDYFKLAQTYTASALDLVVEFSRNREAMAMSLIRSMEDQFDSVWSLENQLPFSWYLLPVRIWETSATCYFNWLREALNEVDLDDSMRFDMFYRFRQRIVNRQAFFAHLCDWLQEKLFPNKSIKGSDYALAKNNSHLIEQFVENAIENAIEGLQSRRIANEHWTEGPTVLEMVKLSNLPENQRFLHRDVIYRPVLCAPFVAAHFCLRSGQFTGAGAWLANNQMLHIENSPTAFRSLLFELRQLRYFDCDWFDEAFGIAFCLGLAQLSISETP